jgi:membrane-associated phospholipid phosphatase
MQLLFFLLAAVSSYSRLYLSQHFALDVLAGMLIGVLSVAVVAHFFRNT